MKNKILFLTLLTTCVVTNSYSLTEHEQKIEELSAQTGLRRSLKYWNYYTGIAIAPATIAGFIFSKNNPVQNAFSTFLATVSLYGLIHALREGHKSIAQKSFRSLYNKRVDSYGRIISDFAPGAQFLPFALDDRQFILFGFAAGYTAQELIHLANKCGRTEVSRQISDGEHFASTVTTITVRKED